MATRGSVISESFTSSSELRDRSSSTCFSVKPAGGGDFACAPCCSSRMSCASTKSRSCWSRMTIIGTSLFCLLDCRALSKPSCSARRSKSTGNRAFFCVGERVLTLSPALSQERGRKPLIFLALELELRGELLLGLRRNRRVVAEFHRISALAAGDRAQTRLIAGHLR